MKKIIIGIILAVVTVFAAANYAEEKLPDIQSVGEEQLAEVTAAPEAEVLPNKDASAAPTPVATAEPIVGNPPEPTPTPPPEAAPEAVNTCTISVRCDTILSNIDNLKPEKLSLVPADGVILSERSVEFNEGESVFQLLRRETKKNGIHMEFVNTPMYNSAYIEGIGNLYEFDCGELSGWMYRVNGDFPNYGCSQYTLKDGDRVEWVYTCDLGKDVGGGSVQYE